MTARRFGRIACVTLGLTLTGLVLGTVLSVGAFAVLAGAERGPDTVGFLGYLLMPAIIGGLFGAVLTAPVAWTLLRAVPLGRAVLETATRTLLGLVLFIEVAPGLFALGPPVGFMLAAVQLRLRYPPTRGGVGDERAHVKAG